jgi:hypothetical protein
MVACFLLWLVGFVAMYNNARTVQDKSLAQCIANDHTVHCTIFGCRRAV